MLLPLGLEVLPGLRSPNGFPGTDESRDHGWPPKSTNDAPVDGSAWGAAAGAHDGIRITSGVLVPMAFVPVPALDGVSIWPPDVLEDERIRPRWAWDAVEDLGSWEDLLDMEVVDRAEIDDAAVPRPAARPAPRRRALVGGARLRERRPDVEARMRCLRELVADAGRDPALARAIREFPDALLGDAAGGTPLTSPDRPGLPVAPDALRTARRGRRGRCARARHPRGRAWTRDLLDGAASRSCCRRAA